MEDVGEWAFANRLTNNEQAWGTDVQGVGLFYAMQGAKVGWIADDKYNPQLIADIERTARLGSPAEVMPMIQDHAHEGFAQFLVDNGYDTAFINTLKMEPHYAGWMHDRAHGMLSIENVAIAHDVNHLTVLSHDQMQPFMNDTWDWPQWPALEVSDHRVLEYFQSMVVLGDPLADHLGDLPGPQPSPSETAEPTQEPSVAPLWVGDFEDGGFGQFKDTPWNNLPVAPQAVSSPTRAGSFSGAYPITAGGQRSENVPSFRSLQEGDDLWFSFSTRLKDVPLNTSD